MREEGLVLDLAEVVIVEAAVLELGEQGRIPAERYATYMEILKEVETLQAAARSRDWKN